MFEHSVKVPRSYKAAANILKKVSTEGGSIKTLLYDNKLRHYNINALYALLSEAIKHAEEIQKMFESAQLLTNEPRLDPWLAKVLTTELLYGKKKLPSSSKPEQTILSYKEQFEKFAEANQDESKVEGTRKPRYVRINTNLLTTSDAIRAFQDEGYRFIRCTSGSYDDYLKQIQNLTEDEFTQDYHVKTVFVFPAGTKLHEHELYLENKIILQDKATTLAVHLLAPPPGGVVLDMCAAPGMKTTQLAAYMRNEGKIYAVERNEARYQTLCDFVEKTGSKCVQTFHRDVLDVKRGEFEDVEYILLDPSCSGSGMEMSVHNYIEDTRLAKLTSLQEKFLKHAMNAFPKARRIIYSTCSTFPEENERVITNVVKTSRSKWRVLDVKELLKGQWNNFGSNMYGSIGVRCLYAKPDDLTRGFFLAVLERDQKDIEKYLEKQNDNSVRQDVDSEVANGEAEGKSKKRNKKLNRDEIAKNLVETSEDLVETEVIDASEPKAKKKKKRNKDIETEKQEVNVENTQDDDVDPSSTVDVVEERDVPQSKNKKRKHSNDESATNIICKDDETEDQNVSILSKKSKKKNKQNTVDVEENGHSEVVEKPKKNKKDKSVTEIDAESLESTREVPRKKKKRKTEKIN